MQYCQTLKPNDRENQTKLLHMHPKTRMDLDNRKDIVGQTKHLGQDRNQKATEGEGKRLIRKKEPWEDRIGMGQLTSEETFKVKETQKIRRDYLKELMLNEVGKNNLKFRTKFLKKHKVSSEVRVRMVSDRESDRLIIRSIG